MNNKISFSIGENPSRLLFHKHEKDILKTRESLYKFLNEKVPLMSKGVLDILKRKEKKGKQENLPVMFELFPWIIKDLTGLSWRKTHQISINWLAINIYVSFLDEHLDTKTEINAEEFLGASVLSQKGLLNLFKIVNGTKFEKLFNDSLFSSANFQLDDVLNQQLVLNNNYKKTQSASGKNQILIACAGAIAASKQEDSKFVIQFTKQILLAVQFLDDLADFEDDFKDNNITVLLNEVAKQNEINRNDLTRKELIEKLIFTNSLINVINQIESSLSAAIVLINNRKIKNKNSNPSFQFFTGLYYEILLLKNLLENVGQNYSEMPSKVKIEIVEKVERAITKIYLHT